MSLNVSSLFDLWIGSGTFSNKSSRPQDASDKYLTKALELDRAAGYAYHEIYMLRNTLW